LKAHALSGFTAMIMVGVWRQPILGRCLSLIFTPFSRPMSMHWPQQVQEDYLGKHMTHRLGVCGFPLARFMSRVLPGSPSRFLSSLMLNFQLFFIDANEPYRT